MPGPPKKPTHLKLVTGNPGRKPLPVGEPMPDPAIPTVPPHLSDVAKVEWGRLVHKLFALGMMTDLDRSALAVYCQAYSDWLEAEEQLTKYGKVVKAPVKTITRTMKNGTQVTESSGGYPMPSPFLSIRNRAVEMMKSFLVEFGMTPAARTRVSVNGAPPKPNEADKASKYFSA